jgi:hypothetical protein
VRAGASPPHLHIVAGEAAGDALEVGIGQHVARVVAQILHCVGLLREHDEVELALMILRQGRACSCQAGSVFLVIELRHQESDPLGIACNRPKHDARLYGLHTLCLEL